MDDPQTMLIGVRADTAGFARDVAAMKADLDTSLGSGAERAGQRIETALLRAVRSGKLGFDDLKGVALSALDAIAGAALRAGVQALFGGSGGLGSSGGGGGLGAALASLVGGLPGRATGGPVSPGRPYMVGERGPELFVPTGAGQVVPNGGAATAREVRVAITVNATADAAPGALMQSSRQVARAVKAALAAE